MRLPHRVLDYHLHMTQKTCCTPETIPFEGLERQSIEIHMLQTAGLWSAAQMAQNWTVCTHIQFNNPRNSQVFVFQHPAWNRCVPSQYAHLLYRAPAVQLPMAWDICIVLQELGAESRCCPPQFQNQPEARQFQSSQLDVINGHFHCSPECQISKNSAIVSRE